MVMATAIMAVGLDLMGLTWPARVLLMVTVVLWAVMAGSFALRLRGGRERRHSQESAPVTLTVVAGTGVLGVTLLLFLDEIVPEALLALSTVVWAVLLPQVVRHLSRRLPGTAFLVTVSTQSLAVLSATWRSRPRALTGRRGQAGVWARHCCGRHSPSGPSSRSEPCSMPSSPANPHLDSPARF